MIPKLLLALALVPAGQALAEEASGTIVINGTGTAAAAPEMTRLRVTVTSLCYDTSRAAKDANAVLANQIIAAMNNFVADPHDKVTASGGPNVRQTEVIPDGSGYRTLCEMKWRSTNTLKLELKAIDSIPDLQDALLAAIDQASAVDPSAVAQTYAELDQPVFGLYPATQTALRRDAQKAAYDDAKAQLDAFADRCSFQDPRLTTISPPEYTTYSRRDGVAMDANSSTPIIPDDIAVTASWKFVWSFTPSANCPN